MKKGFFSLMISFVIGIGYVLFYFSAHHYPFITEPFRIFQTTVMLPRLLVSPDIIMVVLAVFVNLIALIACTPSLAVGAAVFYGVSAGFQPESYPYVIVEFLLCIIAAARMRDAGGSGQAGRNRAGTLTDQKTAVKYTHNQAPMQQYTDSQKAAQRFAENQKTVYHYTENQASSASSQSLEEIRKKFDRYDRTDSGVWKYWLFGIIVAVVVLAVVMVVLNHDSRSMKKSVETSVQLRDSSSGKSSTDNGGRGSNTNNGGSGSSTDDGGSGTDDKGNSTDNGGSSTDDKGSGSGNGTNNGRNGKDDNGTEKIPDLTGYWVMNQNMPEAMANMRAVIADDTITLFWIMENGTEMVYWAGSFEPPKTAESPYTWVSVRDPNQKSAFASTEETKTFTYVYVDGGFLDTISYPVSSGSSFQFKLHRASGSELINGKKTVS